jgi:hypothetical protein
LCITKVVGGPGKRDRGIGLRVFAELEFHPQIQWAKLQALADGARLATKGLWS